MAEPKVRGSEMLWSAQVAIVDAQDALDYGPDAVAHEQERRRPVIYPFNRNGRRGFVAPKDPYQ